MGRALLTIISAKDPNQIDEDLFEACEKLGINMQITNIFRDVGEDLSLRNRLYLPKTLLDKYKISKEDLISFTKGPINQDSPAYQAFIGLWEDLAKISETYYDSFMAYLPRLDEDSKLAVYSSSLIYRAILDELRLNNYDCFSQQHSVSSKDKLKILGLAKANLQVQ